MKQSSEQRGFTLIETLVAIAILTIAIAGPFSSAEQSIAASNIAQQKTVASFLAQEGVEFIRAMRDNAYLTYCYGAQGATACQNWWADFVSNANGSGLYNVSRCDGGCSLDTSLIGGSGTTLGTNNLDVCTNSSCGKLYLMQNGKYTTARTSGGTQNALTPYTRIVTIKTISNTELIASSTVTWSNRGQRYTVSVADHLTAWY